MLADLTTNSYPVAHVARSPTFQSRRRNLVCQLAGAEAARSFAAPLKGSADRADGRMIMSKGTDQPETLATAPGEAQTLRCRGAGGAARTIRECTTM
jgi:hypothetical protein